MRTDYLMPPLPTTLRSVPGGAAPAVSDAIGNDYNGRSLTLTPKVRKAQSFFPRFPRVMALINNTLRRLRVLPRSPNALIEAKIARDIYERFKEYASEVTMPTIRYFENCFSKEGLSADQITWRHQAFERDLKRRLSESFPDMLREARGEHTGLELPKVLCKAYASAIDGASALLGKEYEDAMAAPKKNLLTWMEAAITPQNPSSSMPSAPA